MPSTYSYTMEIDWKPVPKRTQIAAIMGLGCGIGARKMGRISPQITEDELEHLVNWCFSLKNRRAVNDCIIEYMDKIELSNIYLRSQD